MSISPDQLTIYRNLFQGREDIYAYRWEKEGKSWYSPAYQFDRTKFQIHRNKGWTLTTFEEKTLKPLTDYVITTHLNGQKVIGIYPLLEDNTSFFVVADFDKDNRKEESILFLKTCKKYHLPAYLERSRSWNGWHIWLFFEEKYPATKTRKLFLELIRETFQISQFEREVSFDRLFPNQDFLTKKGFWNLIALPLQGQSLQHGNSLFINPETMEAYPNQRAFLTTIQKIQTQQLDELYRSTVENSLLERTSTMSPSQINQFSQVGHERLEIIVRNQLFLLTFSLPLPILKFITDELNFLNSEWLMKKKLNKSVYNTPKYINCIQETEQFVILPRGFLHELENFCLENSISYVLNDQRKKQKEINFQSSLSLYPYQQQWLESTNNQDCGVIVAPPWSGKTVMALELVARKRQKTLIIVHRKQLFDQRIERIQTFLKLRKKEIWQIKGSQRFIGEKITIAMLQTVGKITDKAFFQSFWTIIVDECHHIPAKTFREALSKFQTFYLYGFTATPKRKYNDEKLIYAYLWPCISEISLDEKVPVVNQIIIKDTQLSIPFDYKQDNYETLSKILLFDTARNQQIVNDLLQEVRQKKKILILTERKEHIQVLQLYLKGYWEIVTLSGGDSQWARERKIKQVQSGEFQIFIATGQLLGEGRDIANLEVLFLVYPFSFEGKLVQYLWRLARNQDAKVIYDYRDGKIEYFDKLFKKRLAYYRKLQGKNYQIVQGQMGLF